MFRRCITAPTIGKFARPGSGWPTAINWKNSRPKTAWLSTLPRDGSTIVVQHRASHNEGQEDARGLLRLFRDPVWVAAVLGDFLGFLLNAAALAAGPVVVIQPLVVLMLPVALIVGWLLGGPRPTAIDYLSSLAIVAGLSGFLVLIGRPGDGHAPKARYFALTVLIVLAVGCGGRAVGAVTPRRLCVARSTARSPACSSARSVCSWTVSRTWSCTVVTPGS